MESIFGTILFLTLIPLVCNAEELSVNEFATGYLGMEVMLPCQLQTSQPGLTVIQVTWARKADQWRTLALCNPKHGTSYPQRPGSSRLRFKNPSCQDATLVVSDLEMSDSDVYNCKFTTYPNGSIWGDIILKVLAEPLPERRRHTLSVAVYVVMVLLLVTMSIRLTKLFCTARIQDVKNRSPGLQQGDCTVEYAILNLKTPQAAERQAEKFPEEKVTDSTTTVYAVVYGKSTHPIFTV
ncbi:nectin-2-like [Carcharodon carcharias]|uniref:nectin-2-like n=1 Tax=Carcharodon carcharias TaxID=13397 RepID=UPI001B7EE73B|nr:nectin-2-like [Carcharodon carcharias]